MMAEQGQRLPTPATAADMFQHAAVMELRRLNRNIESLIDALKQPEPQMASDEVALREPEPKPRTRDEMRAKVPKRD